VLLRPAYLDETVIGDSLPWDLYTSSGVLVATAGTEIADREHYLKLVNRPLFYRTEETQEEPNPASRVSHLARELHDLLADPSQPGLGELLANAADELISIVQFDPDACLGLLRILPMQSPAVRHCLLSAAISQGLAEQAGLAEAEQTSLAAAALTMNIAEMRLHDDLARGLAGYTDEQREAIRQHPLRSAELLRESGVDDSSWLDIVEQHHELMDGSGYPRRLTGAEITLPARILRVADYYVAKITGRYYRPPASPGQALKHAFGNDRSKLDSQVAVVLMRRMGIYPPGTLVRLENRETAAVTRHSDHKGNIRHVVSFLDHRGNAMECPSDRDIGNKVFAIRGVTQPELNWPEVDWPRLWGY
jgi:hypothetical protein